MLLGVLDIGSNSAQLQVVEASPGAPPLPTHAVRHPTRLTASIQHDGRIDDGGVGRVTAAAEAAVEDARRLHVGHLFAFVTSTIRDATNATEILDRLEEVAGIRPEYLSGEEEAVLTYLAVRRWYGWSAGRLLLLDIGGGSMEVVLGRDARPDLTVSLPLGAGAMTRRFLTSDPAPAAALKQLRRHVRGELREVADRIRWEGTPSRVVGTSKTFKQLGRLCGTSPQRLGPFTHRAFTKRALKGKLPELSALNVRERAGLTGISAARAESIVAGAVIAHTVMSVLNVDEVELCPWALREGIMLQYLEKMSYETGGAHETVGLAGGLQLRPLDEVRLPGLRSVDSISP